LILSAHQVNFLPYLGFFEKLVQSDIFIFLDDVQFVHTGPLAWMNRNKIRTKEGWQYITVPVYVKGKLGQKLNEVEINNEHPWRRKILGSIRQNYSKTAFFLEIYPSLEKIINTDYRKLIELNLALLDFLFEYLQIDKSKIRKSSQLNINKAGTQRLVELCKLYKADTYISGIHGREYLELHLFEKEGIKVVFQEFKAKEYPQKFSGFVPNLSIIDALFNIGKETIKLIT
jgi:hypothetical protein